MIFDDFEVVSSVTRQSVKSSGPLSNPVTFKTQGESFNMSKLVQETLLKPDWLSCYENHLTLKWFDRIIKKLHNSSVL
jgi:hypothetical protein